ncbi:MAG: helix-turn-helix domain-containing protein [Muribaculaceae bacterium]|nr:helix-turn-helix domain-containing protein [Muribaculaceae bacterium]
MKYHYHTSLDGIITLSNNLQQDTDTLKDNALYKIIYVIAGNLTIIVDRAKVTLSSHQIIALSPYQHIEVKDTDAQYYAISFNSNFYCIYGHDNEVSCGGMLFSGGVFSPILDLSPNEYEVLDDMWKNMIKEYTTIDSLQEEMLRILLKRIIIICTRTARNIFNITDESLPTFDIARRYNLLVDENFKKKKYVKNYADMLNCSTKTLARALDAYDLPSPLNIIHDRIITEAKRLILFSDLSAKEIAWELGFEDQTIFCRFFKAKTGNSVSNFRKLE